LPLCVVLMVSCLLYASRRLLGGLVGHDGHAVLGFDWEPVDRCALVVFFVSLHSVVLFVDRDEFGSACLALRMVMMASCLLCVCVTQAT
jgi:hypothetical protein